MTEDDLDLLRRFVLTSGSLKDIAAEYGVSYPTMRLRLDRLIQRIQLAESDAYAAGFEGLVRTAHAQGKIDRETLTQLIRIHAREIEHAGRQGRAIERDKLDLSSD